MKPRLGCITLSGIIAVILSVLVLGGITLVRGGILFSPGSLNAQEGNRILGGVSSHAGLTNRCAACHPSPWASKTMSDRCIVCHTDILGDPQNFHRTIGATNEPCQLCHTDHRGSDQPLTKADLSQFPHDKLGFSLAGHQKTTSGSAFVCSDCHTQKNSIFDPEICMQCHSKIDAIYMIAHVAAFGNGCLACHDGIDVYGKGKFDHTKVDFVLSGKHTTVSCIGCHAGDTTPNELKATPHDCYACHGDRDPHQGQLGKDCATCHTPDDWRRVTFDHSKVSFTLTGKHVNVDCKVCHINNLFKNTPQDCYGCHAKDDNHQGQFGTECDACHSSDGWTPATFDHSKSLFPLTGAHINVECTVCHPNSRFKGTPTTCVGCHADPVYHAGLFGIDCEQCHTTTAWQPAKFNGAHTFHINHGRANTCRTCHPNSLVQYTCYQCHDQNDVRREHTEEGIRNFSNCMQCHASGGESEGERDDLVNLNAQYSSLLGWLDNLWGGN